MFWRNERGNVSIIAALCLPMVVGGAAYGIETGYWRYDQVRLQQAADAASYAAAVVKRSQGALATSDVLTTTATSAAAANGYTSSTDSITVSGPSTTTPSDANSVGVVITRSESPIFVGFIRCFAAGWHSSTCATATTTVKVSSTASFNTAGDACILALSHNASKSVNVAGNTSMTLNGCSVMSNSLASDALNVQGSGSITAPCLYSAGGASLGGTVSLTTCTAVKTAEPPIADPFAGQSMPSVSGGCSNGNNGPTTPGHYCSITWKNNNPLQAGVYIVDGGSVTINANANVTGSGVTIFLANGASISMNGNAHVALSAPTSGTYSGFLIMSDRSNTSTLTINGDSTSTMTGSIYAPAGNVSYLGNFSGTNGCTQIVAQTVAWSGSTSFTDSAGGHCPGMGSMSIGYPVKLSA